MAILIRFPGSEMAYGVRARWEPVSASFRIQKVIVQKCVQGETEEVSVFSVVRAFGTKRGKVTRKEVFAAAKALEDEGLVIVRGDVVNYIGPSWRDVCKRREGHE